MKKKEEERKSKIERGEMIKTKMNIRVEWDTTMYYSGL